ncbi:MAG: hypothetical protein FJY77_01985 [Candidatus Altiarchaeales archaeon]|nr:hypothetical protein [Candidatus Altiarchaeales archaeon]
MWKNILDPDYREYFITQAQLSRSIRKDGIVHLTLYDECILPLQDKAKKPVVERKIKTKLIMPERALERIVRFLNKVIEDSSKARSSEEAAEKEVGRAVSKEAKEDKAKTTEATSYIR